MSESLTIQHYYLIIAAAALLVNVLLGYIREGSPRFSAKWFFWIHASIPLIIYLRITLGTSKWFIPVSIFMAVLGQIWGGRWRQTKMSLSEKEDLAQIPQLDGSKKTNVLDANVMVTLLNMGGPRINADVRDFQKRLFNDSRLIRFPMSWAFQKLFAWLLVTFRSKVAEKRYQLIGGGSPIFDSTYAQTKALQDELRRRGRNLKVTFSFNYSSPFPDETIAEMKADGKRYLLPVSLYPHYSKATTGSNIHYLKQAARRFYPRVEFVSAPSYHLHEGYIQAFADRIRDQLDVEESLDDFYLIFSAHGLPLYCLTEGDPYPFQVAQTVSRVLAQLNRKDHWVISYQSAVGPLRWLKPSTEDIITALARRGQKKLLIVPISFVTDHIETMCEIDLEYRIFAEKLGIIDFRMSKAIECHPGFIRALADSVEKALQCDLEPVRIDTETMFC